MPTTDQDVKRKDFSWLGSAASLVAVLACYGTLGTVALLSIVGVSVEIDEGLMVKLVSVLLVLALAGMAYSFSLHRHPGPLIMSLMAAALLLWVFYGSYAKPLEMTGFAILTLASIWDFRAKRRACAATCGG